MILKVNMCTHGPYGQLGEVRLDQGFEFGGWGGNMG